ncbi:aminotransferase class IV [Thermophagus sp. OGC60D27]|uniref:aminotransferase class IV n=1 Tax=Thermophagus sp. OGC60D27 TaxID=3458415 RepID=UPI00403808E6
MPPSNKKYLILNGHQYETGKALFSSNNRAFRYGDGLFETIRCHKTEPLFFDDHYARLLRGMATLKISVSGLPSMEIFKTNIERLIVRNRIFYDARVRISVFRRDGGLYTPETNTPAWLIEATPLPHKGFLLNEEGLRIGAFDGFPKVWNLTAPFKTLSSTPNILAGIYKKENHWDDCLILNQNKKWIESISSNLFWTKDQVLKTPSISSGCVDGVMRRQILRFAALNNIPVLETPGATKEELLNADELFLSNAINGVRWIVAFENKRYFNRLPKAITRWLNEEISKTVK